MSIIGLLKKHIKRRLGAPSVERSLVALAGRGFRPEVVFDVGAYHGEFAVFCRTLFRPPSKVVCFEPLQEALARLEVLEARGEITLIPGLVGATDEDLVQLHEMETASSVFPEHHAFAAMVAYHPMQRLDTIIESGRAPAPDLLKIDTQGYEMKVLKGIERNLHRVRTILAELNFLDIHNGVTLAHEVVGWLGSRGWVPYEICSLIRRPFDGALWQSDFIFLKANDPLRLDKRWN
jgi:FkbM family methyltransferase